MKDVSKSGTAGLEFSIVQRVAAVCELINYLNLFVNKVPG